MKYEPSDAHPYSTWVDTNQTIHNQFATQEATVLMFRPDKYLCLTQNPLNRAELLHHFEKGYINVFPEG